MRLGKFLGFLNLQGTTENKVRFFAHEGKYDSLWLLTAFSHFCKLKRNGLIERNNCRDNSQLCEGHQIILSDGRCFMGEDYQKTS
jgi:hypothetical protein